MRGLALVLVGMLAVRVSGAPADAALSGALPAAGEIDLPMPQSEPHLNFDAKERRFSASIDSSPVKKVLAKLSSATGWKVYIDPSADHVVSVQFTNSATGETLRRLLGGLNYAMIPQTNGPSKLFVFHNSLSEATEAVEPAKEKREHGKDWLKNEIIVSLTRGSPRNIDALAKSLGAKVVGRNDRLRTYRLQFESEEAADQAREQIGSPPDLRVDDNYAVRPPDTLGQPQGAEPPLFNLKPDANPDGTHTIVAVVDTAVQPIDAAKSEFLMPAINISGAADPARLASDVPLHGTSMVETLLGSVALSSGGANGSGVRVLPINVYGNGDTTSTYEVTLGIYAAVQNRASVVNLSLGGDGDSLLLDDLIAQARARGVMFFAAAGNTPTTAPTFPAANPLVYAVTAEDQSGNIASYANRGSFIDLIAPGTSFMNYGGLTYRVTGTSPATALVSGAAASYLANGLTLQQTDAQIRQTFGFSAAGR